MGAVDGADPFDRYPLGQPVGQGAVGSGGHDDPGRPRQASSGQVTAEHRTGLGGAHLAGYDVGPGGIDVGRHQPGKARRGRHGEAADQGVDLGEGDLPGHVVVGRHDDDVDVAPGDAAGLIGAVGHGPHGPEHVVGLGGQRAAGGDGHAQAQRPGTPGRRRGGWIGR